MNRSILASLVTLALVAVTALGASLADLQKSFATHRETAGTQRDEQLTKLEAAYLGGLERYLEKVKSSGNLDAVIPVHDEIEAVKADKDPLPKLPDTAASELKSMRAKYADSRGKILKTHAETLGALADKMALALKAQESELTKAGKIDEALEAKKMREGLAAEVDIVAARDLLKLGGQGGSARAALRLRRYGDNLEVLVFYDRRGKISMDSPVVNVREETGKKKELGDTKAKVLGEFVGAKGYEVDPYVSLHQVFDGKDSGKFVPNEIITDFKHVEAGERGLRLSIKPKAVNPCGVVGQVIPPATSKGTYRISLRYFVPKSNRAIAGFYFADGTYSPIGGQHFEKSGKWETAEASAESRAVADGMLFYFLMAEGKKIADGGDDYVVLRELKVEHTRFAAYVQQRFGDHGESLEANDDPQKQTLLISNGQFVQE